MQRITDIFNNREIAIFFWVLIFLFWILTQRKMRKSVVSFIKAFLKISKFYLYMLIYILCLIFILFKINFWDISFLKDTIYWTFGGAFVLFFNINKALNEDGHFKTIFLDCFKLIIILEFISGLYSFNLILELISVPILVLIGGMLSFSESGKADEKVVKLLNWILIIYGLSVVIYSIVKLSGDFSSLLTLSNLKSLVFSSLMTLLLIPFLYFIALYMAYESFLVSRKYILNKNRKVYRFLKFRIFRECNFRLKRIRLVTKKLHVYASIEKEEILTDLKILLEK